MVTIQELIASTGLPPDNRQRLWRVMQQYGYADRNAMVVGVPWLTPERLEAAASAAELEPPLTMMEVGALLHAAGVAPDQVPAGRPAQSPGKINGAGGAGVAVPAGVSTSAGSSESGIEEALRAVANHLGEQSGLQARLAALAEAERSRNATIYETLIQIKQQMGGRDLTARQRLFGAAGLATDQLLRKHRCLQYRTCCMLPELWAPRHLQRKHSRSRAATAIGEADANAEGSGGDSDGAGAEIVEEPDAPPASADRKGPCWGDCCKCSKKWIFDQEGPGSQTWVPCVKDFNCCHEGGPAQFCRQCAAKMSLDNEIEEYKMEVYHELIAEWKAKKLDVTSLFATVPISVIARAELERDGKEPESVPLLHSSKS
eukprot:jgi/Astpho2/3186/Aster-05718